MNTIKAKTNQLNIADLLSYLDIKRLKRGTKHVGLSIRLKTTQIKKPDSLRTFFRRKKIKKIRRLLTKTRRRKILSTALAILILLTSIRFVFFKPQEIHAGWWDDAWHYRKPLTIDNSGGSDSNKKVKFDVDTTDLVDPDGVNFHQHSTTFTEGMAKRDAPGPFAAAPIVQGDFNDDNNDDYMLFSRGNQVSGNFYQNVDGSQGSVVLWWTPETNSADYSGTQDAFLLELDQDLQIRYEYNNNRYRLVANQYSVYVSQAHTAGTTYSIVARWSTNKTLDGTNYGSLSINDVHTFGATTDRAWAPHSSPVIGNYQASKPNGANGIIEGLTIYRRPLFDGTYGVDVGNGDEIRKITTGGSDYEGTHTGSNNQATLTDSTKSWTTDALIGKVIYNETDGSSGTITDNDSTTITVALADGTDDDFDTNDVYYCSRASILLAVRTYWYPVDP